MEPTLPGDILSQLDSFTRSTWGNVEAVLKRSGDFEFLDLSQYSDAFQSLFLGLPTAEVKILVREEYRTALRELETDRYSRGAFVTGQPGIGKSLFLIYIIVAHLGQERPVALQSPDGQSFYVLFKDARVNTYPFKDINQLRWHRPVWFLSDSNEAVSFPPRLIIGRSGIVRAIQATSPKASRWKEWSKQAYAECYVMDIWTEKEIADLAKLFELDVERMATLAERWGSVPRTLLRLIKKEDSKIEEEYHSRSEKAVKKCSAMLSTPWDLPDDAPSQFYFVRPMHNESGINRTLLSVYVPTRTIRGVLGEALLRQDNYAKLDFFHALSQPATTRQAAGYIYESWYHSFFTTGGIILCHWSQGSDSVLKLEETNILPSSIVDTLKFETPPYYWVASTGFPGIDSVLVREDAIFAFQVTISSKHKEPTEGLKKLRKNLPDHLKEVPLRMLFIGQAETKVKRVANKYILENRTANPKWTPSCVGWSEVDPIQDDVTYKVFRDESDPVPEELMDVVAQE